MSYYDSYPSVNVDALEPKEAQRRNAEAINFILRRLRTPQWDDLRFPASHINPAGPISNPGTDPATGMLDFSSVSDNVIAGVAQMPHAWEEGTNIRPHVHWCKTDNTAGNVKWELEYEVVNNGDVTPFTYANSNDNNATVNGTPDDDTQYRTLITSLGEIDMSGIEISGLVFWLLYRRPSDGTNDTYGNDARLIELDFHYKSDSLGSIGVFTK